MSSGGLTNATSTLPLDSPKQGSAKLWDRISTWTRGCLVWKAVRILGVSSAAALPWNPTTSVP